MINYTSHYAFDILFWQHLKGSANISFIASANYISIKDCVIPSVSVLYTYDRTNHSQWISGPQYKRLLFSCCLNSPKTNKQREDNVLAMFVIYLVVLYNGKN